MVQSARLQSCFGVIVLWVSVWVYYGIWLLSWPMSEVLQRRVHSCAHCDCTFASKISRPRWPRRPARAVSFWLPQFSGPTIWNALPVDIRSTDITREQFKRSLKIWLFECAYGSRRVWETVQSEGAPKKWTYLLTYLLMSVWKYGSNVAKVYRL